MAWSAREAKAKHRRAPRTFADAERDYRRGPHAQAAGDLAPSPVERVGRAAIVADYVEAGGEHFTAHGLRTLFVIEKLDRARIATRANPATMHWVYKRGRAVKVKPIS